MRISAICLPHISIITFTKDDDDNNDSQHLPFFSYCCQYFTNSRWFCLHNIIVIPIAQMKKAKLREITWFGQSHKASKSYTEPESKPGEVSRAHIVAMSLYRLLMVVVVVGVSFFFSFFSKKALLNYNWYTINLIYLRIQFDEFWHMYMTMKLWLKSR